MQILSGSGQLLVSCFSFRYIRELLRIIEWRGVFCLVKEYAEDLKKYDPLCDEKLNMEFKCKILICSAHFRWCNAVAPLSKNVVGSSLEEKESRVDGRSSSVSPRRVNHIITASLLVLVEVFYCTRNKTTSAHKVDTSSSLPASDDDGVASSLLAVCYLCLDGGDDEAGQPLRRDCACRGTDAGFVHLSCLTEYLATKNKGTCTISEIIKPWEVCPNCLQEYRNELAVDIATKCVSYVRVTYPRDTRMQVDALFLKLRALKSMFVRFTPVQMKEFDVIANVMLSLIDRLKGEATPLSKYYSEAEAYVYNTLGQIAIEEGTEESVKRAVGYFARKLKVSESIGHAENILIAKRHIALAKSKFKGATIAEFEGINNESIQGISSKELSNKSVVR